jgi:hypothetical protein
MGSVVAVGPAVQMLGWSLVGVDVREAESVEEAAAHLRSLPSECSLLLLSAGVEQARAQAPPPPDTLVAVLP